MIYISSILLFLILMHLYFRIAEHYNIIDRPNSRSSHTEVTIRGGGIIFVIAGMLAVILHPQYWLPGTGVFLIGTISFIDDRITLSSKIRLLIHVIAVTLMFIFLNVFSMPFYWAIALYIIAIGIINMYNFMDGINGITGAYTLVVLIGLQYVNLYKFSFIEADLIWLPNA
jgi:UDP-N-acetylmuramyl pentapeptide phosphotransferase/UDP-N-acetylglucosamine-1-phosphate transferase